MTTLNTIIEEEKKNAQESIIETFDDGTIHYCPRDLETKITTAMQRAYENGKADSAQENTPYTEWEKIVKIAYGTDMQGKHYVDLQDLRPVFDSILTSRDTYWKERVGELHKKWEGKADSILLRELDNLK